MSHSQLVKDAKSAIDKVFSDTSASREKIKKSLEKLSSEVDDYIEILNGFEGLKNQIDTFIESLEEIENDPD